MRSGPRAAAPIIPSTRFDIREAGLLPRASSSGWRFPFAASASIPRTGNGVPVQQSYNFDWVLDSKPNLILAPIVFYEDDILRPVDFSGLPDDHKYVKHGVGFVAKGSPLSKVTFNTKIIRDGFVLIDVPSGQLPITANETFISETMNLKPTRHLEIDNIYILDRLLNGATQHAAFNNRIIRSKWNYQSNPAWSLRFITQYNCLPANPLYSSLATTKKSEF